MQLTHHQRPVRRRIFRHRRDAFTLIELVLVMAILVTVLSVTAAALGGFFRGQTLDAEARRFLALTRYARSRAVAEGVPMLLWVDPQQRAYGLEMQPGYSDSPDPQAKDFVLDEKLQVEVAAASTVPTTGATGLSSSRPMTSPFGPNISTLRFTPDGFIAAGSPESVTLRDGDRGRVVIAQSRTRAAYEIQSDNAR